MQWSIINALCQIKNKYQKKKIFTLVFICLLTFLILTLTKIQKITFVNSYTANNNQIEALLKSIIKSKTLTFTQNEYVISDKQISHVN